MKSFAFPRRSLLVLVAAACMLWCPRSASAIGFLLSETKEELKLQYTVAVHDYGNGRVSIEFTLIDEGRLKPLDEVQFQVLAKEPGPDGGYAADLLFSIQMHKGEGGKSHGYVTITKDLAERAEILLNTHTMDGKLDVMTRLHHVIPVKQFMNKPAPAAPAEKPAATPKAGEAAPPPASKK